MGIVGTVNEDLSRIQIQDNGADIFIESTTQADGSVSGDHHMQVDVLAIQRAAANLQQIVGALRQLSMAVRYEANHTSYSLASTASIKSVIFAFSENVDALTDKASQLHGALTDIATAYEKTEKSLTTPLVTL